MFVDMGNSMANTKRIKQPEDFKLILDIDNPELNYKYSFSKFSTNITSIYTYKENIITLLRFPKKSKNIVDNIIIENKNINYNNDNIQTTFLGFDNLICFLNNKKININQIILSIKNFSEEYIKERKANEIYLSFPIHNTFYLSFNTPDNVKIHCKKNKSFNNELELNEFMIIEKNEFIYIIYLKPFNSYINKGLLLKEIVIG
ncbi:hypothetical protein WH52_12145 [Tenacibaculum holothuriorum]|uniref:Uncharacterized protein n=2 Tax=Tenacibaculum holothuriorum TaxID=1635173 RepID=A0A1Y2PC08_9FLAO|nr:hypothetical protein WH52_12145 [Tenacibaculum holothuriorum]